jgi:transcriptional regulator with XRE-family HTH domain
MIDSALRHVASEAELAARLSVDQQRLWNWKNGKRSMPDASLIELARIAGLDPKKMLGEYHYEWHEKKMGTAHAGIAAAVFSAVATIAPIGDANASGTASQATHYAKALRRLRLLLRTHCLPTWHSQLLG